GRLAAGQGYTRPLLRAVLDGDGRDVGQVVRRLRGYADLVRRVEVEVPLGRDPLQVRLGEAGGQEERPVLVLLDDLGQPARAGAVGLVRVVVRRGHPPGALDVVVVPARLLRRRDRLVVEVPFELVGHGAFVDLAHAAGEVAAGVEVLLQRPRALEVLSHRREVVPDVRALGPPSAQQRAAGGAAHGDLRVGV